MSGQTRKVVIKFDALGGVAIDAVCYQGASCKEATKAYEELFAGGTNKKSSDKPEFFESDDGEKEAISNRM